MRQLPQKTIHYLLKVSNYNKESKYYTFIRLCISIRLLIFLTKMDFLEKFS